MRFNLIGWNKFLPPHHQPEAQPRVIWVVTRHQYGISVLVPGTSFLRETSVGTKLLHYNFYNCTYPNQVKREKRFHEMHIPKSRTNRKTLPIQVTEEGQWRCSHVQLMRLILLMKCWWWTESTGGEGLECIDDVPLKKKLGTQWIHVTSQSLSEYSASKSTRNAMKLTNQINNQSIIPSTDVTQLTLTLKMTTTQVVETSATANNNSPIQDYVHPDDQTQPTFEMTPDCVQIFHTTTLLWTSSWSCFEYQHAIRKQNYFQKLPVSRSKYHYSPVLSLADDRRWSGIDNKNTTQPQQSSMT